MQYLIIALVVVVAVAAVIVPLVRAPRGAAGDLDPLPRARGPEGDPAQPGLGTRAGEPQPLGSPTERPPRPASPASPAAPEPTVRPEGPQPPGERDVEELPVSAPPPPGPPRPLGAEAVTAVPATVRAPLGRTASPDEEAVLRYREALRAGTVCPACSAANPPGSRFCMECGENLGGEK